MERNRANTRNLTSVASERLLARSRKAQDIAAADFKLSSSGEATDHFELRSAGQSSKIDFLGRRHRKLGNVDPY